MMRQITAAAGLSVAAITALCGLAQAQDDKSAKNLVVLREAISNKYAAMPQSFKAVVENSQVRAVKISQGATISGIISRIYGVGLSDAPAA